MSFFDPTRVLDSRAVLAGGLLLVASPGCHKSWAQVLKENDATIENAKSVVLEAKKAVEAAEGKEPSEFPDCTPTHALKYDPAGSGENDTDIVDLGEIKVGGKNVWIGYQSVRLSYRSTLATVLGWSQSGGGGSKPSLDEIARFDQIKKLKNLIVIRQKPGSVSSHFQADVFLVTGKPAKIACAFPLDGPQGHQVGTEATRMKETKYNKKTGKTISEREYTVGGYHAADSTGQAMALLEQLLSAKLGLRMTASAPDPKAASAALSSNGEKKKAGPTTHAPKAGGKAELSVDGITFVLSSRGARFELPGAPSPGFGLQTNWHSENQPSVYLFDGSKDTDKSFAFGPEQAVCVTGTTPAAQALADGLVKKNLSTPEATLNSIRALGFTISTENKPNLDTDFTFAHRSHLVFVSKGKDEYTLWVLDYAEAAKKKKNSAVRVADKKVLVVSGEYSESIPADALAAEIAGK